VPGSAASAESAESAVRRHERVLAPLAAVAIAAAAVSLQDPRVRHDRFQLPAFDAYVYVAMAERPAFFTVAPWGYRVLTPWVVDALPVPNVIRGFRRVTLGALALTGAALFAFLRRLGHGVAPSLLAVAVFGLSPPVGEAVRDPFLAEPLAVLLLVSFLLALEAGAGAAVLALVAVLGALAKEVLLLLLPLAYAAGDRSSPAAGFATASPSGGERRSVALVRTVLVALPAVVATVLLRFWWAPWIAGQDGAPMLPQATAALRTLVTSWGDWWAPILLYGLAPVAVLGALRARARPLVRRYGWLTLLLTALPLAAGVYSGDGATTSFFALDVPRLLIYVLPLLLAFALVALDRVWPHMTPPPPPLRPGAPARTAAAVAAALFALAPAWALDRYRRVDLRGARDGPLVLALSRESLRAAHRLDAGRAVVYEPEHQRFVWGESDRGELGRMRWYLRDGWGGQAHYGTGPVVMHEREATLLVPCLRPRALQVVLETSARTPTRLAASVNGEAVGEFVAGPGTTKIVLRVPAGALVRGDNPLTLAAPAPAAGVRLERAEITAVGR
jgi:hypothetical protein